VRWKVKLDEVDPMMILSFLSLRLKFILSLRSKFIASAEGLS